MGLLSAIHRQSYLPGVSILLPKRNLGPSFLVGGAEGLVWGHEGPTPPSHLHFLAREASETDLLLQRSWRPECTARNSTNPARCLENSH